MFCGVKCFNGCFIVGSAHSLGRTIPAVHHRACEQQISAIVMEITVDTVTREGEVELEKQKENAEEEGKAWRRRIK